jgi:hypothetical protein
MEIRRSNLKKIYFIVAAITGWLALIIQFYLIIVNKTAPIPETVIRFFSYYTILTNALVAVCFTSLLTSKSGSSNFFASAKFQSAVTVYITIVGLIYNLILRQLWAPTGLQKVTDELLHTIIPIIFIFHWFLFVPKINLKWTDAFYWLLYPLIYLLIILLRGSFSGFYPYPFIEVDNLGYQRVIENSLLLCLGFLFFSFLLIAIAKLQQTKTKPMEKEAIPYS